MKILYVGHYMPGCTTRMRGEYLEELLNPSVFDVVDIDQPINKTFPLFRPLGWRLKAGPLIYQINKYLKKRIDKVDEFDLVWIDKGVFIDPNILARLKSTRNKLVHFTPDTAFMHNQSELFYDALPLYDYCVTTKSFERKYYESRGVRQLLFCTQGYDPRLHKSYHSFSEKKGIAFVGKHDAWREQVIAKLLEEGFEIKLAGADWNRFARKNQYKSNLQYYGEGLFGEAYANLISGSLIGLGLLAKHFPEKHTTRSFEIPACGTVLATERNEELLSFYGEKEVLFFSDLPELIEKIKNGIADLQSLEEHGIRGRQAVVSGGYDYRSIMEKLLHQMNIGG